MTYKSSRYTGRHNAFAGAVIGGTLGGLAGGRVGAVIGIVAGVYVFFQAPECKTQSGRPSEALRLRSLRSTLSSTKRGRSSKSLPNLKFFACVIIPEDIPQRLPYLEARIFRAE